MQASSPSISIELERRSPIKIEEDRFGNREILASPDRLIHPVQFALHLLLTIVGLYYFGTVLTLLPLVLLSPLAVFDALGSFYQRTMRGNCEGLVGFRGRYYVYPRYLNLVLEIAHHILRGNAKVSSSK
jgi:hypothetical protein